jgi:hypothetical protein
VGACAHQDVGPKERDRDHGACAANPPHDHCHRCGLGALAAPLARARARVLDGGPGEHRAQAWLRG